MKFVSAIVLSLFMSCSYAQVSTENITPPTGKVPMRVLGTSPEDTKSCNDEVTNCVLVTKKGMEFIGKALEDADKKDELIKKLLEANKNLYKALKECKETIST